MKRRSSSNRAFSLRHRHCLGQQSRGCSVGHVEAGERFSPESKGECPPSEEALSESVRFTPRQQNNCIVMGMQRNRSSTASNPSALPETAIEPSSPLNTAESVLQDLPACVGICRKSCKASFATRDRHARLKIAKKKAVSITRSSIYRATIRARASCAVTGVVF